MNEWISKYPVTSLIMSFLILNVKLGEKILTEQMAYYANVSKFWGPTLVSGVFILLLKSSTKNEAVKKKTFQ